MAAGSLLAQFLTFKAEQPSTLYAPTLFLAAQTGVRPYNSFDGTTDWSTIFTGVMPPTYSNRGVTAMLWLAMSGANSGTKKIAFSGYFERDEVGVALGAGGNDFASARSNEVTVDNTTNVLFTITIGFTNGAQMDSVVANDLFRFRIQRTNATAGTNATGAGRLFGLALFEA